MFGPSRAAGMLTWRTSGRDHMRYPEKKQMRCRMVFIEHQRHTEALECNHECNHCRETAKLGDTWKRVRSVTYLPGDTGGNSDFRLEVLAGEISWGFKSPCPHQVNSGGCPAVPHSWNLPVTCSCRPVFGVPWS